MIFLYILGGILLLLLLLLLIKVSFFAAFCDGKPYVAFKVWFFTFPILDGSEKPAPHAVSGQPAKPKKPKKQKKKRKKEARPEPGEPPTLSELASLAKQVLSDLYAGIKRGFRLEELRAKVLVASDDAADTAIRYGAVCALLSPVQAFADAVPKRKKNEKKILVGAECDFLADKPEIDVRLGFSFRVGNALMIALRSAKDVLALVGALNRRKNNKQPKGTDKTDGLQTDDQ